MIGAAADLGAALLRALMPADAGAAPAGDPMAGSDFAMMMAGAGAPVPMAASDPIGEARESDAPADARDEDHSENQQPTPDAGLLAMLALTPQPVAGVTASMPADAAAQASATISTDARALARAPARTSPMPAGPSVAPAPATAPASGPADTDPLAPAANPGGARTPARTPAPVRIGTPAASSGAVRASAGAIGAVTIAALQTVTDAADALLVPKAATPGADAQAVAPKPFAPPVAPTPTTPLPPVAAAAVSPVNAMHPKAQSDKRDDDIAPAASATLLSTDATPAVAGTPAPSHHATAAQADAAPPQASIAAALGERQLSLAQGSGWLDQLARDIASTAGADGKMHFTLNPNHLGSLQVEVARGAEGASVRMTADSAAARDILVDAQPQLVAEARAQGVRIAGTHVDLGGQGLSQGQSGGERHAAPQTPAMAQLRAIGAVAAKDNEQVGPRTAASERYA